MENSERHLEHLTIDDDGDDVDIVIEIERAFDIKLSNREVESCNTVGEIYDLVLQQYQNRKKKTRLCLTSACF